MTVWVRTVNVPIGLWGRDRDKAMTNAPSITKANNRTRTTKTGYHLLRAEALPLHFWQSSDDSLETVTRLEELRDSMQSYGVCWIIWDAEQESLYQARDLYRCSIISVAAYDILDRGIPYGDLHERASLPLFFSASEFEQILETSPFQQQPITEARAFLISTSGDKPGNEPEDFIEVMVPVTAFCAVADRARSGAVQRGERTVLLHRYFLYLKAALLALHQGLKQETDPELKQALAHQLKQLRHMRDIRDTWKHQHKQYIHVDHHSQDEYIVHVGLHSSLVQEAA